MIEQGRSLIRYALACALALVSTAALVLTLVNMVPEGAPRWMAVVAGVSLQCCLYLFSQGDRMERVISGVLLVVSVLATAGYAEYSWQIQQANQQDRRAGLAAKSYGHKILRQQIDDETTNIHQLQQIVTVDTKGGFRGRVVDDVAPQIAAATARRSALFRDLQQLEKQPETVAPASMTEATLSRVPEPLRAVVWLFLACIIDVCALLGFRPSGETVGADSETVSPVTETASSDGETGAACCETEASESETPPEHLAVITRIRDGVYGHSPLNVRKLLDGEGIRHDAWKEIKQYLVDAGELVKDGQRFEYRT